LERNEKSERLGPKQAEKPIQVEAKKRQKGHENLEKEQQRATYCCLWKHIGMSQENVIVFGYP